MAARSAAAHRTGVGYRRSYVLRAQRRAQDFADGKCFASCRIRYAPQVLELSGTGIAPEEISEEDFSEEMRAAVEDSVSELSI